MGYIKIFALYKCPEIFEYEEVCVMEKIHGTSTHIYLKDNIVHYKSGGEQGKNFEALFDKEYLFEELNLIIKENSWVNIKVHGECYGGKQQNMAATYGPDLKFIVFDIKVNCGTSSERFLNANDTVVLAERLKLEFVLYRIGKPTPEWLDEEANSHSLQAIRNGMGGGHPREGIVVKPLIESTFKNGHRAISKHKSNAFWEIKTPRPLNVKLTLYTNDNEIANDWVTEMRARHVIDKMLHNKEEKKLTKKDTSLFVDAILQDIIDESEGEIVWTEDIKKAIRRTAGPLFISLFDKINLEYQQSI